MLIALKFSEVQTIQLLIPMHGCHVCSNYLTLRHDPANHTKVAVLASSILLVVPSPRLSQWWWPYIVNPIDDTITSSIASMVPSPYLSYWWWSGQGRIACSSSPAMPAAPRQTCRSAARGTTPFRHTGTISAPPDGPWNRQEKLQKEVRGECKERMYRVVTRNQWRERVQGLQYRAS